MNHDPLDPHATDDAALSARLRALPQQRQPPAQLWERIAPALTLHTNVVALQPRRQRAWAWAWPAFGVALAAALAVVAIVPGLDRSTQAPAPASARPGLVAQAQAMAGQYQQAIDAVPVQQVPADLRPALAELDQSAQAIHHAIAQSPRSAFLLSQLQRTYAKRLQLTRLASQGETSFPS
ncbi:hypothetical protein [Xanthomonas arboricola]|uniref:hypothetical protein n=1 Tax=Xanthomonas arboricola TaxID=56448 RepID=UPI001AF93B65|nr:hypothetical protein [Xanthomonas arboricola]CAD7379364.1 hypothetical protein X12_001530 [Xanthomonas arboricola]CAG2087804.1 hypothetical protein XCY_001529 [Xanthomonas arboricola pv. juglandis]